MTKPGLTMPVALGAFCLSLLASVCGCSNDAPVDVPKLDAGLTINGHPFSVQAQGAGEVDCSNCDVPRPNAWIVELYASGTAGCVQFMSNAQVGTVLQFHFPLVPFGTHDVSVGNTIFYVNGNPAAAAPDHGTLSVITADCQHVVGSYDVTFKTGEHLAGTFDAPTCACESVDGGTRG